jgi:geranylgeranyl reductase family protein
VTEPADVWDVAVIGAGPAGAMAALAAASRGLRVVIIERFSLPRYKTCAGGLVGAALRALPDGFTVPVQATATQFTLSFPGRPGKARSGHVPLVSLVHRSEFDALLVARAAAAGAVVRDAVTVTGLVAAGDAMRIIARDSGELQARAVVGADGSAGRSSAFVGVRWEQVDLGLEVEVAAPGGRPGPWLHRVHLHWGTIPGGYAWVFPKGETLSVGVIGARGNPGLARSYLRDFLGQAGLKEQETMVSSGHLTRCRTSDSPLYRDRVLVAGDAAGLLDPWTREGISFALRSGTLAGEAAARAAAAASPAQLAVALDGYSRDITATLAPEMEGGFLLSQAFTRHPRAFFLAVTLVAPAWNLVTRAMTGKSNYATITRWRAVRLLLRVLGASR